MIKAIVYMSNTGHTKEYAELLGKETGLPVYERTEAAGGLPPGEEIIYLGWLMAGTVMGCKKTAEQFVMKAVCGVGMAPGDSQVSDIRKMNPIEESTPVFCLQGGFEMEKLHGIYKLMMKTMKATVGKKLAGKADRTPEEDEMLRLLVNGGSCVSADKLEGVLSWYRSEAGIE